MTEQQIDRMEELIRGGGVFGWKDGPGVLRITEVVASIGGEPSRCARLLGGGYIALWNVDPDDLVIMTAFSG